MAPHPLNAADMWIGIAGPSPALVSRRLAWARAVCLALGLHAAAIAALLVHLPPWNQRTTPLPPIAIRLDVPAAPPAPVHDVPTPRRIEAPRRPAATPQAAPQPRPVDAPPRHLARLRRIEPVAPLQRSEAATPMIQLDPTPPSPTTADQAAPDRTPDVATTAPIPGGALLGDSVAADRWEAHVLARIELTKRYPRQAMQNHRQDDVRVELAIERTGTLRQARIVASGGFAVFDDAALDAVRRAAPFDPPPNEIAGDPVRIAVIVRFVERR